DSINRSGFVNGMNTFSQLYCRWTARPMQPRLLLVPKFGLGTPSAKLRFESRTGVSTTKIPKQEFGNQLAIVTRQSILLAIVIFLYIGPDARAGLHCSLETIAELPSQWRGFLLDQRSLRLIALKPSSGKPVNRLRNEYEGAVIRLEQRAHQQK